MEIISALHQRFGPADYTCYLGWLIGRGLSTPDKGQLKTLGQEAREKEEKERLTRQRALIKVATELWLVGLLRSLDDVARPEDATARGKENNGPVSGKVGEAVGKAKSGQGAAKAGPTDAEPFPLEVLKDLLGHDKEHVNLPLVVLFVKTFGWDVLGIKSSSTDVQKSVKPDGAISAAPETYDQSSADEDPAKAEKADDPPLTTTDLQQRFKNVLNRYFEDVKVHIIKDNKSITAQGRRNAEAYVKSGEVFEDRQSNYDKQLKSQEKLIANAQILCDALENQEMPDLKEKETQDTGAFAGIGLVKTGEYLRGQSDGAGIWEDDEERRFYENLIDLQDRVPGVLLEDGKKKKSEGEEQVGKRVESNGEVKEISEKAPSTMVSDDQTIAIANKGIKSSSTDVQKSVKPDGAISAAPETYDQSSADEDPAKAEKADDPPLTTTDLQQRFKNVLNRYFEDVKVHIIKDNKSITAQGRRNAEAYVKSGEVFEDRQSNYDKQLKSQEKLIANAQILCDALENQEMPDLKEKETQDTGAFAGIGLVKTGEYLRGQSDGAGIWEDDEERRFYENLIDLQDRVPGVLLEDGKKKKSEGEEQVGKRVESNGEVKEISEKAPSTMVSDDQTIAIANKTVGAQVDAILARLPELQNKEQIDQTAMDFCFLNSKASRNRLIKAVQEVPKGRSDLLPSYARLVATLGKYMPDISHGLVSYLDDEFRSLQRRKQKDFLGQVRTSNIRYLAELTKFGVVPEHVIFHCLKVSLDDFSRMNIEIIGNLLENCGRYLLRNPDTAPRMSSFLETLQRKKTAQHLGQQERMLIENAMYYVNPPERAAIEQKERTPVQQYVWRLVYLDMNKRTYTKVLKSLRKLHWEEHEVSSGFPDLMRVS